MILAIIMTIITLIYIRLVYQLGQAWRETPLTLQSVYIPDVSIIVVFRNEEKHITTLLEDISQLDVDDARLEVILIDDDSQDSSVKMIEEWNKDGRLNIRLDKLFARTMAHKKEGIELGIANARNEFLVLTDADCRLPRYWLRTMITTSREKLLCGPVCYTRGKTLISKILELEMLILSAMAGSTITMKKPILANGANLGYSKTLFFDVGGYSADKNQKSASGDDVDLMRDVFKKYPKGVHYIKNAAAIVETEIPQDFQDFFFQRIRWAGKTKFDAFKPGASISLKLILMYMGLFIIPFILIFNFSKILLFTWLISLICKYLIDLWYFKPVVVFFDRKNLIKYLPLAQILHLVYIVPVAILSMFITYKWKGRSLHG